MIPISLMHSWLLSFLGHGHKIDVQKALSVTEKNNVWFLMCSSFII